MKDFTLKELNISVNSFLIGAGDRTRTYDPIITNDVLYQLSYTGVGPAFITGSWAAQERCCAKYRGWHTILS